MAGNANRDHGLPLTKNELKKAVGLTLRNETLRAKNDSEIAEHLGCDATWVGRIRLGLERSGVIPAREEVVEHQSDGSAVTKKKGKRGPKTKAQKQRAQRDVSKDGINQPIPEWMREIAADKFDILTLQTQLSNIMDAGFGKAMIEARRLQALASGAGARIDLPYLNDLVGEVAKLTQEMVASLGDAAYYCTCPDCLAAGEVRLTCEPCDGKGWMTRAEYEEAHLA